MSVMPEKTVLEFDLEAADTVAYYVKQDVICEGFFCRQRRNRRESTFSIQTASPGMPAHGAETRRNIAPQFVSADNVQQKTDLFENAPIDPDAKTLSNTSRESNPPKF